MVRHSETLCGTDFCACDTDIAHYVTRRTPFAFDTELVQWGAGGGAGGSVLSLKVANPIGGAPVEFCFKTSFAAVLVSQLQSASAAAERERNLAEVGRSVLLSASAAAPPAYPAAAAPPPTPTPAPTPAPAATVTVACPKCRTALAVGGASGSKAKCPNCGQKFKLP
jgi:hypothetical protein